MGITFDKEPLAAKKNYVIKTVNAYIANGLDNWPNNSLRNFTLKSCLFGATSMVKNSVKESGSIVVMEKHLMEKIFEIRVMILLGKSLCFFVNSFSSHVDNRKNNFLMLGETHTYTINKNFGAPEKNFSINFT